MHMRLAIILAVSILFTNDIRSQGCCSGGSGSPLAGGAAAGVLQENQVEVSANYQFNQSDIFLAGDKDTTAMFDQLSSNYLFMRFDYGLSDKLTMSIATGYFFDKTLIESSTENPATNELETGRVISSSGFGDLILLPRYDVLNRTDGTNRSELALGLGVKIAIGSHTDSNLVISHPLIGDIYTISPPTVQTTNGSNDLLLYGFYLKSFHNNRSRLLANALYIRKGFNSLGQKFGDYGSVSLFYGRSLTKKIGFTAQVKAEIVTEMESAEHIDLLAYYNIYKESTGSKKLFFIPQISYSNKDFTFYATSEIPMYQYVNGSQVGSQYQITAGLNYRFFTKEPGPVMLFDVE